MANPQIIEQRQVLGKEFKMYGTIENPLFLARDVANWIEHSNVSMMLSKVDEDEKQIIQIGTLNNAYSAWFLTENGLYEVLMQSRKPIAKQFKKKVKEILKQIRKTGGYIPYTEKDDEKTILAKAVDILNKTLAEKNTQIEELTEENIRLQLYAPERFTLNSLVSCTNLPKQFIEGYCYAQGWYERHNGDVIIHKPEYVIRIRKNGIIFTQQGFEFLLQRFKTNQNKFQF